MGQGNPSPSIINDQLSANLDVNGFSIVSSGNGDIPLTPDGSGLVLLGAKTAITPIGGFAIRLTNKTGSATIAGQLVETSTTDDDAVGLSEADGDHTMGVLLEAGIADGAEAWVIVLGIADVAMEDNTAAIHGHWVRTSITDAGYADSTNPTPPGGGITELDRHLKEIGHCIESVSATGGGTHILARCTLHFN